MSIHNNIPFKFCVDFLVYIEIGDIMLKNDGGNMILHLICAPRSLVLNLHKIKI